MTPTTFSTRLHGRGGQGVVTAAELLSVAAFVAGAEAQAIPSFGSERMGAPVTAFCRISDRPIRAREPISEPDAVIVVDATLLHHVDVFAGLTPGGYVLVNSVRSIDELGLRELAGRHGAAHVISLPASDIAWAHLSRPLPNVCLLGAFAALTGVVSIEAIATATAERFEAALAGPNVAAAQEAHRIVLDLLAEREAVDA